MSDNKLLVSEERAKALRKTVYNMYMSKYKNEFAEDPHEFMERYLPGHQATEDIDEIVEHSNAVYISNKQLSPILTFGLMVTFSPDPTHELGGNDLNKIATKLCKPTKGIRNAIWCIEQRGENDLDMGHGAHFHALLYLNKDEQMGEPGKQTARIVRQLKQYQTKSTHFLQIKRVGLAKLDDKKSYIMGDKDNDKNAKLYYDKAWRSQIGLSDYYTTEIHLPPLAGKSPPPPSKIEKQ